VAGSYGPPKFAQTTGNVISVIHIVFDEQAAAHGARHAWSAP